MKSLVTYGSVALVASTLVVSASALAASQPAASGILFGLGKSSLKEYDIVQTLTSMGYSGISGGTTESKVGISLGYRHGFSSRFSLDAQYVQQNISETPLGVTVISGTDLDAATAISKKLPKLAQGVTLAGVYHAPLSPKVSAKIGGGAFLWQGKRETQIGNVSYTDEDNGTSLMLQLGLGYRVSPSVSIEGNLQHFFMPDDPINRATMGIVYHF